MLQVIGKLLGFISDVGDMKMVGEIAIDTAALGVVEEQIKIAKTRYAQDKSASSTASIRATLNNLNAYLRKISWPSMNVTDVKDYAESAGWMTKAEQTIWARQMLVDIAVAQWSGELPRDALSWPDLRRAYERQRGNLTMVAIQFEHAALQTKSRIKEITEKQYKLISAASDDGADSAKQKEIKRDMELQLADEKAAKRTLAIFTKIAESSAQGVVVLTKLIDAGDRATR
jgi:hypothetical protein